MVLAQPREVSEGTGDASNRWQVSKSCSLFSDFVVATSSATFEPVRRVEYAVVSPAARAGKSASAVNRLMTLVSKTEIAFGKPWNAQPAHSRIVYHFSSNAGCDNPNAVVQLLDTGHFATDTHVVEIVAAMKSFWLHKWVVVQFEIWKLSASCSSRRSSSANLVFMAFRSIAENAAKDTGKNRRIALYAARAFF